MKTDAQLVTDIMGTKITNPDGVDVGVIQNVMLDSKNGAITYIVLCYANFIGKINRHYAIPRQCLEIREADDSSFYFVIGEEKLLSASGLITPGLTFNSRECVYELFQNGTTEFKPKYAN
ncbi:PRC-barrel domain-containing protein [Fodinibius sp.]|uniref:PRC-barrel domain-containing protein n=1 Tax=Fodinibius sp. TaxID=1872440 RepID=UPI00356AD280